MASNATYAGGVNCADITGTADDLCVDDNSGSTDLSAYVNVTMLDNSSLIRDTNTSWITSNQLITGNTSEQIFGVVNNGTFVDRSNISSYKVNNASFANNASNSTFAVMAGNSTYSANGSFSKLSSNSTFSVRSSNSTYSSGVNCADVGGTADDVCNDADSLGDLNCAGNEVPYWDVGSPASSWYQADQTSDYSIEANAGWNGYTLRNVIDTTYITQSGSSFYLNASGSPSGENTYLANTYICERDSADDCVAGTVEAITWDTGSATTTINVGTTKLSDIITYTIDADKSYLISFYMSSAAADTLGRWVGSGAQDYYTSGDHSADVTFPSSTADTKIYVVSNIYTISSSDWACGVRLSDYSTNLAWQNQTNNFTKKQIISNNVTITERLGVGTSNPSAVLDIEYSDGVNNNVVVSELSRHTSTTANTSLGGIVDYRLEDDGGTGRTAVQEYWGWENASSATRTSYWALKTISSASLKDALYVSGDGKIGIGTTTPIRDLSVVYGIGVNQESNPNIEGVAISSIATGGAIAIKNGTGSNKIALWGVEGESSYINNGGKVGIGTPTPSYLLDVGSKTNRGIVNIVSGAGIGSPVLLIDGSNSVNGNIWALYGGAPNNDTFSIRDNSASAYRLTIDGSGNVGIGTTTPKAQLDVSADIPAMAISTTRTNGNTVGWLGWWNGTSATGYIGYGSSANNYFYFTNYASGGFYYTAGSKIGIGSTPDTYQLQLSSDSAAKPSTNTWTIVSDKKSKKDIKTYNKSKDDFMKVNITEFVYTGEYGTETNKTAMGVIADDIKDILPNAVKKINATNYDNETEEIYTFNSHELWMWNVKVTQQQQEEIDMLKQELCIAKPNTYTWCESMKNEN